MTSKVGDDEQALHTVVREALRGRHVEVRLLCPKGHYIADVAVYTWEGSNPDTAPVWMQPRASNAEFDGSMGGRHGFHMDWDHPSQATNVVLVCRNKKCGYRGTPNFFRLAVQVGAAGLAGQTEYSLFA